MVATCTGIPDGTADWSCKIGNCVSCTRTDVIPADPEPTGTRVATSDPTILSAPVDTRAGRAQHQSSTAPVEPVIAPATGDRAAATQVISPTTPAETVGDTKLVDEQ